jgi:hypothetical protein
MRSPDIVLHGEAVITERIRLKGNFFVVVIVIGGPEAASSDPLPEGYPRITGQPMMRAHDQQLSSKSIMFIHEAFLSSSVACHAITLEQNKRY